MAMNFFESQDVARRKTGRLVVLFLLAVISIVALIYLAFAVVLGIGQAKAAAAAGWRRRPLPRRVGLVWACLALASSSCGVAVVDAAVAAARRNAGCVKVAAPPRATRARRRGPGRAWKQLG